MGSKRIDETRIEKLLEALRKGHYVEEACEYARIDRSTYYRWIKEAEALDEKYERGETLTDREIEKRNRRDTLKEAEVVGQNVALNIIFDAMAGGTWQAAAWFMERRNKKWSNRQEVTGKDGGPIESVSVDELDAKLMNMINAARASETEREINTGTHGTTR